MLGTIAVTLLAVVAVANIGHVMWVERNRYGFVWEVWRRFRFGMLAETCLAFVAVVATYLILTRIPGLQYGWMNLFYTNGGNVLVQPLSTGSASDIWWVRWLPVLFISLFLFVMPFIAHAEEQAFRNGAVQWNTIVKRSIVFGPVHCIVGVPIAAGLALIVAGLFYGYQYRRAYIKHGATEALMASTTYHTLWNTLVVGLLLAASIAMAVR